MTRAADNRERYESAGIVRAYRDEAVLQPAEALIFLTRAAALTGADILDIGCGTGRTTRYLLPLAGRYVGCDYAGAMLARCRERFPQADLRQLDARDLATFADGSFDVAVFSFNGLDSVDHAGRLAVLAEVRRVLRPGGLFIFSSHNRAALPARIFPRLILARSPCRLAANLLTCLVSWRNFLARRHLHRFEADYAQTTDQGGNYTLLNYSIDPPAQARQAAAAGFAFEAAYAASSARQLAPGETAPDARHVYYVLRKPAA